MLRLAFTLALLSAAAAAEVKVDILTARPDNAKVTTAFAYDSQVTLSIEAADGSLTPSGWSTRKAGGGNDQPFSFTPGQNLIAGWTEGVLQMREGERAVLHVPSEKGYGASPQGSKGGGWYIPAVSAEKQAAAADAAVAFLPAAPPTSVLSLPQNSNLHFDIEILGKKGKAAATEL
jgi:hypothetical protein